MIRLTTQPAYREPRRIAFVRDPQTQYVPMQRSLTDTDTDAMTEYLGHTGARCLDRGARRRDG